MNFGCIAVGSIICCILFALNACISPKSGGADADTTTHAHVETADTHAHVETSEAPPNTVRIRGHISDCHPYENRFQCSLTVLKRLGGPSIPLAEGSVITVFIPRSILDSPEQGNADPSGERELTMRYEQGVKVAGEPRQYWSALELH